MMISAFAKGAQILNDTRYAEAARAAADFLRRHLWDDHRQILLRPASGRRIGHKWLPRRLRLLRTRIARSLRDHLRSPRLRVGRASGGTCYRAIRRRRKRRLLQHRWRRSGRPAAPQGRLRWRRALRQLRHGAAPASSRAHDGSRRFPGRRRAHPTRFRLAHGRIRNRRATDAGRSCLRVGRPREIVLAGRATIPPCSKCSRRSAAAFFPALWRCTRIKVLSR